MAQSSQNKAIHASEKKQMTSDGFMSRKVKVEHQEGGKLYKLRNPVPGSSDKVIITGKGGFAKNFEKRNAK